MKKLLFFLVVFYGTQSFSQINITKDPAFGNNGIFTADFSNSQTILNTNVIVLPDNSILYLINSTEKNYILKLTPNGALDSSFANNGKLEFQQNNFMNAMLQGDKIIVCFGPKPSGDDPYEGSKIIRYDHNGILDITFGQNGVLNEVTESINPQALSVLVLADQSLIITNSDSTNAKKFTADGKLDTTFGTNGEISYSYHFPMGQASNGKIATCDINSLSSSVYSFYDLNSLETNTVLNLNQHSCHHHNGALLQNKTNLSTRMTSSGMVYSVFEYKNYPLPDFSRLIVMKGDHLDSNFNGNGFATSEDYEQFLDMGFSQNQFIILNQKANQKALNAFSTTGNALKINNNRDFNLLSGHEIEVKDNFILVNSILPDQNQNLTRVKIEKYLVKTEKLSTSNTSLKKIEVENPVRDFLNIRNAENAESFELFSIEGKKVLESKNDKRINTTNLPKGNYILKINMKNGEHISKKLIKN